MMIPGIYVEVFPGWNTGMLFYLPYGVPSQPPIVFLQLQHNSWYLQNVTHRAMLCSCYTATVLMRVKGLEADNAHKIHGAMCLHQHMSDIRASSRKGWRCKGTVKRHSQDVFHAPNPEAQFSIIIIAVSNISSVTVWWQGQQSDFWNVPCELQSMWCTSKYTLSEREMSFFKVTGASTRQIMCLALISSSVWEDVSGFENEPMHCAAGAKQNTF